MRIVVRDHGSLRVEMSEGDKLELVDGRGRIFGLGGRRVVSLCRCGQSKSQPFCDRSHEECGFESAVEARELPPAVAKP